MSTGGPFFCQVLPPSVALPACAVFSAKENACVALDSGGVSRRLALTNDDMLHLISTIYGPASSVAVKADAAPNTLPERKQNGIAPWESPEFSVQLLRNSVADNFALILLSKGVNARAEAAIVEATKIEAQERPQKEADQRKKEAADLELLRQKNKQIFQP